VTRRAFVRVGGLSLGGLSMAGLLRQQAQARAAGRDVNDADRLAAHGRGGRQHLPLVPLGLARRGTVLLHQVRSEKWMPPRESAPLKF
jgi:hypothetical protein